MTRDGQLPLSRRLARVNPRTSMPSAPAVVVGVLAAGLLLLAYAMVTGPLLVARLRGRLTTDGTDETGNRLFSLGRWREPVNALALLYGLVMTVNLARPRGVRPGGRALVLPGSPCCSCWALWGRGSYRLRRARRG